VLGGAAAVDDGDGEDGDDVDFNRDFLGDSVARGDGNGEPLSCCCLALSRLFTRLCLTLSRDEEDEEEDGRGEGGPSAGSNLESTSASDASDPAMDSVRAAKAKERAFVGCCCGVCRGDVLPVGE
jgi:hypothetical protein